MKPEEVTPEEAVNLREELRVGNTLTAELTDRCRELELQVEEAKKQERERIFREIKEKGDVEFGFGDAETGDVVLIQILESDWLAIQGEK